MNYYNATELLPFTKYDFYLITSNIGGSVTSPEVRVKTLAGIPTSIPPLIVRDVTAHSATFEWKEPSVAFGPIERYVLQVRLITDISMIDLHLIFFFSL